MDLLNMDRKAQLLAFLEDTPNDPFLLYALALEYVKTEDEQAIALFERLMNEHPEYLATYYHFGKWKEKHGDKEAAMEVYREGIKKAKAAREQHTLAELQSALLELEYE